MSYDIHGQHLMPGHCEVHPHVHEPYPCRVCMAEAAQQQQQPEPEPPDERDDRIADLEAKLREAEGERKRLNGIYKSAVNGRKEMRDGLRRERQAREAAERELRKLRGDIWQAIVRHFPCADGDDLVGLVGELAKQCAELIGSTEEHCERAEAAERERDEAREAHERDAKAWEELLGNMVRNRESLLRKFAHAESEAAMWNQKLCDELERNEQAEAKLAEMREALEAIENMEPVEFYVGRDDSSGGGAEQYDDFVPAAAVRVIARKALSASPAPSVSVPANVRDAAEHVQAAMNQPDDTDLVDAVQNLLTVIFDAPAPKGERTLGIERKSWDGPSPSGDAVAMNALEEHGEDCQCDQCQDERDKQKGLTPFPRKFARQVHQILNPPSPSVREEVERGPKHLSALSERGKEQIICDVWEHLNDAGVRDADGTLCGRVADVLEEVERLREALCRTAIRPTTLGHKQCILCLAEVFYDEQVAHKDGCLCLPDNSPAPSVREEVERLRELAGLAAKVERCPHCGDEGFYAVADSASGEPELEQCEWCHTTPHSVFSVRAFAAAAPNSPAPSDLARLRRVVEAASEHEGIITHTANSKPGDDCKCDPSVGWVCEMCALVAFCRAMLEALQALDAKEAVVGVDPGHPEGDRTVAACDNCFKPMKRHGNLWVCPACGNSALAKQGDARK